MNNFLENYKMKIHALSPIYIGDGKKISKKEYINLSGKHKVIIPDSIKMYHALCKKGFEKEYTDYLLYGNLGLNDWLRKHNILQKEYQQWTLYEMDSGDAFVSREARPKEILTFTKDPYGNPYVPGSSIKGMFRTALLSYEINRKPDKYKKTKEKIRRNSSYRKNKKEDFLSNETTELENIAFHTLQRDNKNRENAVNSCLAGLIISDSLPLSTKSLTLSQKIEYKLNRTESPLPILRETLIPGTDIYFDISIDKKQCPYAISDIINALDYFQQCIYKYFYSRFGRGSNKEGIVWLGGGCGFLSKTILYPLFEDEAVRITDSVFRNTLGDKMYTKHKHTKDIQQKLAPHICKCTRYNGRLYDMGMGKIELL